MQLKKITSPHNPFIKDFILLRDAKNRRKQGRTIVEGIREISRAVSAGIKFEEIYVCPELYEKYEDPELTKILQSLQTSIFEVSPEIFEKLSFGERLEGLIAACSIPQTVISELNLGPESIVLVVEHVEKPGNLGAILRTAEAAGVSAMIVCDSVTDVYNPNVIRASLGSVFLIPTVQLPKEEVLIFLKEKRIKVCATVVQAEKVYIHEDLRPPIALVFGSEQKGLSPFWIEKSELKVKIPMRGVTDSLNVSVSAAIIIYESIRQQTQPKK